jgi:hypothetical protein
MLRRLITPIFPILPIPCRVLRFAAEHAICYLRLAIFGHPKKLSQIKLN